MKNLLRIQMLTLVLLLLSSVGFAQHFTTVWSGYPYQSMAFIVQSATIDGVDMEAGDEIAVFDDDGAGNEICVGVVVLTGVATSTVPATFAAAHEELGGDGFISGNTIIYKFWDNSESIEITAVVSTYMAGFATDYSSFGTAVLTSLEGATSLETTVQSITSCQGSVVVPIDVSNFNDVGVLSLVLNYETTNLTYTDYQDANPALTGLSVSENAGEITFWLNITPVISIGTGTFIELLFDAATVYTQTTANLTWDAASYYEDGSGASIQSTFIDGVVTIDPIPADAGDITGATSVCQGITGESYQVAAITNATSYVWSITPVAAGVITVTGTTGAIDFSDTYDGLATIEVYGSNSCGDGGLNSIDVQVIPKPTAIAGADMQICEIDTYTLQGQATNFLTTLWSSPGDGSFDDATSLSATYMPGVGDLAAGTVTLILTANPNTPCAVPVSDDIILSFSPMPIAVAGTDATICENDTYTLSGTAQYQSSILWTGGDGSFDDATSLTATYTPGTTDITNGSVVLILTSSATTPCSQSVSDDMTINITLLPVSDAGPSDAVCETNPVYALSGTASNQTSVLWSGGDGTFDDATLLTATYTAGSADLAAGSVTLTLTAYPDAPCATNATDNMVLTFAVLPTANAGADDETCLNTASYQLVGATASDYTSVLWTTDGDGTFVDASLLNPEYLPGTVDRTNGTVDLTITATSVAPCDASDDMTLSFAVLPTSDAGTDAEICEDNTYQLSGLATDYSAILWTTDGDGTFDDDAILDAVYTPGTADIAAGAANLTLTAYPNLPCVDDYSDPMVLSIQLLPVADAGADDEICLNTPSYELVNATAANQSSLLWTTAGDGTFDDATLVNPTYTPGANDIANFTVTLTMTTYAVTPCTVDDSDEMVLTFAVLPTADAGVDNEICEDNTYQLSGLATYYSTTLWTTLGDGTFDDATSLTAIYTPGDNDKTSGTASLTLTAYASFPCVDDASDAMLLWIGLLPIADAGPDEEICLNTPSYYLEYPTAANQTSVLWSTSGDGAFDDATLINPTYTPGTNDIANFEATLSITAYANTPCTADDVDDMLLTFAFLPEANAGADDEICETDDYTLSGSYENGSSTLWTTSGDGTFDDATIVVATYTPGTNDIANETVSLTLTAFANFPCTDAADDMMTLSIISLPTADAGMDDIICEDNNYVLSGVATNQESVVWSTSGDGSFNDVNLLNATYMPGLDDISNGAVNLTLTANAITPCATTASDDMVLEIQALPLANAGGDASICEGDNYALAGAAINYISVLWATNGDGSFDNEFILNAVYTPGPNDINGGHVTIHLFAYGNSPCGGYDADIMQLTINSLPGQPELPDGPTIIYPYTPSSQYTIDPVANATSYHWYIEPIEAGSIDGNNTIGTTYWNVEFRDAYAYIHVVAINDCGETSSEILPVWIDEYVGVNELSKQPEITIAPNPSNGKFNILIEGATDDIELFMMNNSGQVIHQEKLINTTDSFTHSMDIGSVPNGTYYIKFVSNDSISIKKVIIK